MDLRIQAPHIVPELVDKGVVALAEADHRLPAEVLYGQAVLFGQGVLEGSRAADRLVGEVRRVEGAGPHRIIHHQEEVDVLAQPGEVMPVQLRPHLKRDQPVFQLRMIPVIRGNTVPYFPHPLFILYFRNKHAERTVPQVQALALVLAGPPRLKSTINTLIRRTGQAKGVGA